MTPDQQWALIERAGPPGALSACGRCAFRRVETETHPWGSAFAIEETAHCALADDGGSAEDCPAFFNLLLEHEGIAMKSPIRTYPVALALAAVATLAAIGMDARPPASAAFRAAAADQRRALAEARQCIQEFGPGVAVVRDAEDRAVCVPEVVR